MWINVILFKFLHTIANKLSQYILIILLIWHIITCWRNLLSYQNKFIEAHKQQWIREQFVGKTWDYDSARMSPHTAINYYWSIFYGLFEPPFWCHYPTNDDSKCWENTNYIWKILPPNNSKISSCTYNLRINEMNL